MLSYAYIVALIAFGALSIAYRIGTSTLRCHVQMTAPHVHDVIFPSSAQPSFGYYTGIAMHVLFKPDAVSPPLPHAVVQSLVRLRRIVIAAGIAFVLGSVLLAVLVAAG